MGKPYMNVAEPYPLYDTIIVSKELFGKEQSINGWFTSFGDFAANERHTFFKSRTIGNSNLAYCNMDSADNVDFAYKIFSIGVRFFAPVNADSNNQIVVSPEKMNDGNTPWWLWELPKHCGFDFRIQQDTIIEDTCAAVPPGYGPRLGCGAQPIQDIADISDYNMTQWQAVTGTNGEPCIDNRFSFGDNPIEVPRNATIEANIYPSVYARTIMADLFGPHDAVLPAEEGTTPPGQTDYISFGQRYGITVSLYGYRMVQQRGQYFAPGAVQEG